MATTMGAPAVVRSDERFFLVSALVMTAVIVMGFSVHLALGRSSFSAPWYLHLHALLFFGWVALYLTQTVLVATGNVSLHRRLGWAAALFVPAMVAAGTAVTVAMVQRGDVPFFFTPAYFLVMDPLTLIVFAGLVTAAIRMRRRTAWHRRLMLCAMAILTGPALGRLLPLPLVIPWAGTVTFAVLMLFPLAGAVADVRRSGAVHTAWLAGIVVLLGMQAVIEVAGRGAIGAALVRAVAKGTPGATIDPFGYAPPPGPPLIAAP